MPANDLAIVIDELVRSIEDNRPDLEAQYLKIAHDKITKPSINDLVYALIMISIPVIVFTIFAIMIR